MKNQHLTTSAVTYRFPVSKLGGIVGVVETSSETSRQNLVNKGNEQKCGETK